MRRIEAVIFDLDGLIVDSEPLQLRAINQALAPVGITLTETDWTQRVGYRSIETIRLLQAQHRFERDLNEIEQAKLRAYQQIIRDGDALKLMPGVHVAIHACQSARLKLTIASSSTRADIAVILSAFELEGLFEVVVAGDEVSKGKPNPEIFLETARRMFVDPAVCMVLEDAPSGIAAANAAGMFSVAIPNRFTQHQDFSAARVVLDTLCSFAKELDTPILKET